MAKYLLHLGGIEEPKRLVSLLLRNCISVGDTALFRFKGRQNLSLFLSGAGGDRVPPRAADHPRYTSNKESNNIWYSPTIWFAHKLSRTFKIKRAFDACSYNATLLSFISLFVCHCQRLHVTRRWIALANLVLYVIKI